MTYHSEFSVTSVDDWVNGRGPKPCADFVIAAVTDMARAGATCQGGFMRRIVADWFRKLADAIERENKQAAEQVAREAA